MIFTTKPDKEKALTKIKKYFICPGVTETCCTTEQFQSMEAWWGGEEGLSMNHLWRDKIDRIYTSLLKVDKKLRSKVLDSAKKLEKANDVHLECTLAARKVIDLNEVKADEEAFKNIKYTSRMCWDYTVDFLRGLTCGMCDYNFDENMTSRAILLNEKECRLFADRCSYHLKAYRTVFTYIRLYATIADCQSTNQPLDIGYSDFFDPVFVNNVNDCMFDNQSNSCIQLCETNMPFTGITKIEYDTFIELERNIHIK